MKMRGYTYREIDGLLRSKGWFPQHRKSSHISYAREGSFKILTVPQEKGELSRPLCKRLLKEAGIC